MVPLIAAALDRFPTWSGTSAVYPRLQYPNVDQFFYFQNAVSLGQKVRKNTTPNVRIELALVDAMFVPPEVPPPAAADPCGLGALQHGGGDPFLWRGTGPAPPLSGVTPQCYASALAGVSQSGATPKNAVLGSVSKPAFLGAAGGGGTSGTAGATAGAPAAPAAPQPRAPRESTDADRLRGAFAFERLRHLYKVVPMTLPAEIMTTT